MKTIPFLKGKLVRFRPIEPADSSKISVWLNDPEVTHFMFFGQFPQNQKQASDFILNQVHSPQNALFGITDKSEKLIGFCGLYDLHFTARKAELRMIIGEKKYWGKGCGTEATELLLFYGFDRLNLNRIYLMVVTENKGAVRIYEKSGFKHEGLLRDHLYRNSRWYDSHFMAILRKEYYPILYQKHQKKFFGK